MSLLDTRPKTTGTTLRMVAEAAGVSVAAVSKVLHGKGKNVRVSEVTAETIRNAAEQLRYHPNVLARSLRTSRTQTVGLVWEHMQSIADGPQYYVHLLDGVSSTVFSRHYRLTILPELPKANPVRALCDGRLDGLIWCKMPDCSELREELHHVPLKVVALNSPPSTEPGAYPSVSCDNEHGARLVVDHLADLGHRHILMAFDEGWESAPDAHARLRGFRAALAERGLPFDERSTVVWSKKQPAVREWLATRPPHTAIFGWHEAIAGSVVAALTEAGVRVPEQMSVVGFDSTLYCDSIQPRLTAVRQPVREMAALAAETLLNLIEGGDAAFRDHVYPCTLDVRASTSFPAPR